MSINPDSAKVVVPTVELINSEMVGLEGKIYEDDILKDLLMMSETVDIQYDSDITFSVEDLNSSGNLYGGINGASQYDSEDYVRELRKYIASPIDGSVSEYVFHINTLYAREKKWLGAAILVSPCSNVIEITYSVKSKNSDGNLSGRLMCALE